MYVIKLICMIMRDTPAKGEKTANSDPVYYSALQHEHIIWGFTGIDSRLLEDWFGHLKILESNPEYRENVELDAFSFEFMNARHLECVRLIRQLLKRRQLEIVGGSYTAPPMIIIGGESNIRQILLGRRLIERILGTKVRSFAVQEGVICSHPQLPQILAGTDYGNCVLGCFKGYKFANATGKDGTIMPTIVKSYWDALPRDAKNLPELMKHCSSERVILPMPDWGWGAAQTEWIKEAQKYKNLRIVTISEFFIKNKPKEKTVLSETRWTKKTKIVDLDAARASCLLDIANGCEVPKASKHTENLLLTTERYVGIGSLFGIEPRIAVLKSCWKNLFKAQAHDVYFDGSIPKLKTWAMNLFERVNKKANILLSETLFQLAEKVDTRLGEGKQKLTAVIVFNQLPWEREELVELKLVFRKAKARSVDLLDKDGNRIVFEVESPEEYADGSLQEIRVRFKASLPSMGYTTYYMSEVLQTESPENARVRRSECKSINNGLVEVARNDKGEVTIREKRTNVDLLKTGFLTLRDQNGHDDSRRYRVKIEVAKGILTSRMTVEGRLRRGVYRTILQMSENSPKIDFDTVVDLKSGVIGENVDWWCMLPETGLANNFVFDIDNGKLSFDYPFGCSQSHSLMLFPLNWIDYSNRNRGVSVFHCGTHGFWIRQTKPLRLMNLWLWSRIELDKNFSRKGLVPCNKSYAFKYAVVPHDGKMTSSKLFRKAAEYNSQPIVITTSIHGGKLPREKSFMNTDSDNILLSALAGHRKGLLLRFYEVDGKKTFASIRTDFPNLKRAYAATMSGKAEAEVKMRKEGEISMNLRPFEIATVLLTT